MRTLSDERVLKEFKTVIVPGCFNDTFANVSLFKSTPLFTKYIYSLEKDGFINRDQATRLEFKFVRIIQKRGEHDYL